MRAPRRANQLRSIAPRKPTARLSARDLRISYAGLCNRPQPLARLHICRGSGRPRHHPFEPQPRWFEPRRPSVRPFPDLSELPRRWLSSSLDQMERARASLALSRVWFAVSLVESAWSLVRAGVFRAGESVARLVVGVAYLGGDGAPISGDVGECRGDVASMCGDVARVSGLVAKGSVVVGKRSIDSATMHGDVAGLSSDVKHIAIGVRHRGGSRIARIERLGTRLSDCAPAMECTSPRLRGCASAMRYSSPGSGGCEWAMTRTAPAPGGSSPRFNVVIRTRRSGACRNSPMN